VELVGESLTAGVATEVRAPVHSTLNSLAYLQVFSATARLVVAARLLPGIPPGLPKETTQRAYLQALRKTGATGLEPATSGVTGRRSNQLNYAPGVGLV
jgi:hypothetical protein